MKKRERKGKQERRKRKGEERRKRKREDDIPFMGRIRERQKKDEGCFVVCSDGVFFCVDLWWFFVDL